MVIIRGKYSLLTKAGMLHYEGITKGELPVLPVVLINSPA